MSEYQRSITVHAPADRVFAFVSNVENLPKYLPTVRKAILEARDRVEVEGEVAGHPYDSDGPFRVDREACRMEWGSVGENRYHGWLQVQPASHGAQVTIHLSLDPDAELKERLRAVTGSVEKTIQQGLDEALESIRNLCERQGGKVQEAA